MEDLPHVSQGDPIKADDWNKIVDVINGTPTVSFIRTKREPKLKIALAEVRSVWTRLDDGFYHASVRFFDEDKNPVEGLYDVVSLMSPSKPIKCGIYSDIYVIWRNGRWEYLSKEFSSKEPKSGEFIHVNDDGSIDNTGLRTARIATKKTIYHDLCFNPKCFETGSHTEDIIGADEIYIKQHTENLVYDVVTENGALVFLAKDYQMIG